MSQMLFISKVICKLYFTRNPKLWSISSSWGNARSYALLNSLRHKNEGTLKPTFCPELCTLVFFALYGTYFYWK